MIFLISLIIKLKNVIKSTLFSLSFHTYKEFNVFILRKKRNDLLKKQRNNYER